MYARLTQAQLRSRREPEKGIFIAESPKVIGHALDAGCVPLSLLMERRQLEGQGRDLVEPVSYTHLDQEYRIHQPGLC